MSKPVVTTGKIFIDSKGAGRIYLKKKIVESLNFRSGEDVKIEAYPDVNVIVVSKVDTEKPVRVIVEPFDEERAEWERKKEEALKVLTDPNFLISLLTMRDELDRLRREIEELKRREQSQ